MLLRPSTLGLFVSTLALVHCALLDSTSEDADSTDPVVSGEQPLAPVFRNPLSFLVASDLHFENEETPSAKVEELDDNHEEEEVFVRGGETLSSREKNQAAVEAMVIARNSPARLAEHSISSAFQGLIVTGDITDNGQPDEWQAFMETYPASLGLPVYETAGNHDYPIQSNAAIYRSPSDVFVLRKIAARNNATTRPGLKARSPGGSFAWKWGDTLFVNLGVKPSDKNDSLIECKVPGTYRNTNPFESLAFLKDTLRRHATTATPVVLAFHYPIAGSNGRVSHLERAAVYDTIKDYNVVAITHGHNHKSSVYSWCGIPVLEATTPKTMGPRLQSSFLAVDLSNGYLSAQTIQFQKKNRASAVEVDFDPNHCTVKKPDVNHCWVFRRKLSAISVDQRCNVDAMVQLR